MKTREEILKILADRKPEIEKRFKVKKLALFGSYARGDYSPDSDVDILVDVDPTIGLEFVSLAEDIENSLGMPVELISMRAVNQRSFEVIKKDLVYV
jgi:uncharacterized protein